MSDSGANALRATFFEECEELLEAMQDGFDQLEDDPRDAERLNAVFRAAHSIKGGAAAFGFEEVVAFAHEVESALDRVRGGHCDVDAARLDLFRQCGDVLSDLLAAARGGTKAPPGKGGDLLERLTAAVGGAAPAAFEQAPDFQPVTLDLTPAAPAEGADEPSHYDIVFHPLPELFASGNEPVALFRALAQLGRIEVDADLSAVPPISELEPGRCAITWRVRLQSTAGEARVREVFEFVDSQCSLDISVVSPAAQADVGEPASSPRPGDDAPAIPSLSDLVAAPTAADNAADTPPPARTAGKTAHLPGQTIRVDLDRLDHLINLVGELVIKEAMLSQSLMGVEGATGTDVAVVLQALQHLVDDIQEGAMAIRAQPVKPVFQRMARTVREAGAATGKRVRLITEGEHTEVDKTVLERLVDPLTHLIRNAIDHGLEPPELRAAARKPPEGTVLLSATHRSGRLLIDVADDGGGIDRERVRAHAVARGLVAPGVALSGGDIDNLLFEPGLSCKDEVSKLSGRGVGLDVVRSEIHALGGRVSIQSDPGEGTTFSISLPLTLAVLEGMLIEVAGQTMVVPVSAIRETLQPAMAAVDTIGAAGWVLRSRDGLMPVVDLGAAFGFRPPCATLDGHVLMLIAPDNTPPFALVVDAIRDQRQVVIKSLEANYRRVPGVAAATILGDGKIALIVDPNTLPGAPGHPEFADSSLQLAV